MNVVTTTGKPIKLWLDDIEDGAMEQALNLAHLPFLFKHVAVMPDSHQGYGMPIGGVIATENVVIPNAVGVDIGCGMCAIKTSIKNITVFDLKNIMSRIYDTIPLGFSRQSKAQNEKYMPYFDKVNENMPIVKQEYNSALFQLGTLGGGNHFIEIQKGDDGHIWIMIHSGSRNLGHKVATHYNKLAIALNKKWHSSVPLHHQLAFLSLDTVEGEMYIQEMNYCVDFALANRKLMMHNVKNIINDVIPDAVYDNIINIAHNYAVMENHFGSNVMVHRKGATRAYKGELGIIPGSQGTSSYIVCGKGNEQSFKSCSHGAGRKMGRKQAQLKLDLTKQQEILNKVGVLHRINSVKELDEAPGAYKDISVVMKNQEDLVDIVVELKPLAVIKG